MFKDLKNMIYIYIIYVCVIYDSKLFHVQTKKKLQMSFILNTNEC